MSKPSIGEHLDFLERAIERGVCDERIRSDMFDALRQVRAHHAEIAEDDDLSDRLAALDQAATPGELRGGHRCDGAIRATVDGDRISIGEAIPAGDAALWAELVNAYRRRDLVTLCERAALRDAKDLLRDYLNTPVGDLIRRNEAKIAELADAVRVTLAEVVRMDAILLMAGEMTAQERRTARAVANGSAAKVEATLARFRSGPHGYGQSAD